MSNVTEAQPVAAKSGEVQKAEGVKSFFDGKLVSVAGNKLVMKSEGGKEYSHTLEQDAKVTCDGTACKPEDLKAGNKIRVTTKKDDRNVATGIEAICKNAEFTIAS